VSTWFFNRQRGGRVGPPGGFGGDGPAGTPPHRQPRGPLHLTSIATKILAPAQAYTKYLYADKIKPEVVQLWKLELAKEDNTDYIGDDVDGEDLIPEEDDPRLQQLRIPIAFTMQITKAMYENESAEVKAEVEKRRQADFGPVEKIQDVALRQQKLQQMQK
jgi:hypothetical protein